MTALFFLFLALSVSPFKSKSRLEAESAALRHQLIVLQRRMRGRVRLTPRYLIRDQDCVYGAAVTHRLRTMGIRDKPIAPGSPWQNGFAERLIGCDLSNGKFSLLKT